MTFIPKPLYTKIQHSISIACVDTLILYNHHILFVKRLEEPLKDKWFIPGGRMHYGESWEECAIRKAREEVGLIDLLPGLIVNCENVLYEDRHNICFCYTMYSNRDKVVLDATLSDYRWVYYKDITEEYIANDYVRRCLERANLL